MEGKDSPGFYDNLIQRYAEKPVAHVNLKQMLEAGQAVWKDPSKTLENAQFLQRELPKRLAKRLLDLQFLPYIVVINPNIKRVYEAYYQAFHTMHSLPLIEDFEANAQFTTLLKRLVEEHGPLVESLAAGLRECKRKPIIGEQLKLDRFLNSMLTSRISRRVLAEQHIALQQRRDKYIGIVCTDLSVSESIEFAIRRAQQVCIETYGINPDVRITGDKHVAVSYIPTHLDYMLFELLKNAMRATVEKALKPSRRGETKSHHLPPVEVKICMGDDDNTVTLKISDQGGGISDEDFERVWHYGFTTVEDAPASPETVEPAGGSPFDLTGGAATQGGLRHNKMAGLGFGLPLSKLYARYFGGDIQVVNVTGYGVDVYLWIHLLDNAESIDIE